MIKPEAAETLPTDTLTVIYGNGSKWYGEAPDSIDTLIAVMTENTLDLELQMDNDRFCELLDDDPVGAEYYPGTGWHGFLGNFEELSHNFHISTRDPALIARLKAAIDANLARCSKRGT